MISKFSWVNIDSINCKSGRTINIFMLLIFGQKLSSILNLIGMDHSLIKLSFNKLSNFSSGWKTISEISGIVLERDTTTFYENNNARYMVRLFSNFSLPTKFPLITKITVIYEKYNNNNTQIIYYYEITYLFVLFS